jgi:sodium-dependent dicarboxylate transporter 2/3/5
MTKPWALWSGLAAGALAGGLLAAQGHPPVMCRTAGIAVVMAVWWITEAVNLYFTGLLPVMVFPLLGIMPARAIAPLYMKEIIFLFLGGFMLAYAVERWDLHRRIALGVIRRAGASPVLLLGGFMLAAWFLSMWILNTAAATLLLPAALAILTELRRADERAAGVLAVPLLLGVAYGCNIGGTATLVGTMPNLVLKDFYAQHYPDQPELSFAAWFQFGLPLSAMMLLLAWALLSALFVRGRIKAETWQSLRAQREVLPAFSYEEKVVAAGFGLTILAWFTMQDIHLGALTLPGWVGALGLEGLVHEGTVAMAVAGLLFLWPSRSEPGRGVLGWSEVERIPIGVIFLFGGGFALAAALDSSGLSAWLAAQLGRLQGIPLWWLVWGLCLFTTFFTELTSNTAATILMLNLLAPMAAALGVPPLALMLPVTITASYAFMLPVATPPNTIVYATGRISVGAMARTGLWLNLLGTLLVLLATRGWGLRLLGGL